MCRVQKQNELLKMKDEILKAILKRHETLKNKSGVSVPFLSKSLGIEIKTLKKHLNELVKENKIFVREGINEKLIFTKKQKR